MTQELSAKLERLKHYKTRYELVATSPTSERVLAGYTSRRNNRGIQSLVVMNAELWCKVTSDDSITYGKKSATMGGWKFAFSGRTQRDSYIDGELPFITTLNTAKA